MNFLAYVAEFAREHQFNLRMHILDVVLNLEVALFDDFVDVTQFGGQGFQFRLGQQAY